MITEQIWIVDDDSSIRWVLEKAFANANITSASFDSAKSLLTALDFGQPEVIISDIKMPEMDGMETCMEMRANRKLDGSVIAFLTARGEDYSQIAGFDAGADDYITKPIKPRVLISRMKALLRRAGKNNEPSQSFNGKSITIDRERYLVTKDGKEMSLPKKEFELLSLLTSQPGKVFTRSAILSMVWGKDVVVGDRTIDVHIRKLREKLGDAHFRTVKGVGYKFEET